MKNLFDNDKIKKNNFFLKEIKKIHQLHKKKCKKYDLLIGNFAKKKIVDIEDIPFLPVSLFKEHELISIEKKEIYKILFSSGTTSIKRSKIVLDKENSFLQRVVLAEIFKNFIGGERLPFVFVEKDLDLLLKKKKSFSASEAAVLGFVTFSSDRSFVLKDDNNLNIKKFLNIIKKYKTKNCVLFGFTSTIWEKLIDEVKKNKLYINMINFTLIHGGGWKKLKNLKISDKKFKSDIKKHLNIDKIINYYGMVEQIGSIFFECEHGFFHCSDYSDIFIKNENFENLDNNKIGLIHLLSTIPKSYPGHSILTEDLGKIIGVDNCKCGRKGKYFKVLGRIPNVEVRGCSDVN